MFVFLMPAERVQKIRSPHRMHSEQIHTPSLLPLSPSSQPAHTITSYFKIPFKKELLLCPAGPVCVAQLALRLGCALLYLI